MIVLSGCAHRSSPSYSSSNISQTSTYGISETSVVLFGIGGASMVVAAVAASADNIEKSLEFPIVFGSIGLGCWIAAVLVNFVE